MSLGESIVVLKMFKQLIAHSCHVTDTHPKRVAEPIIHSALVSKADVKIITHPPNLCIRFHYGISNNDFDIFLNTALCKLFSHKKPIMDQYCLEH